MLFLILTWLASSCATYTEADALRCTDDSEHCREVHEYVDRMAELREQRRRRSEECKEGSQCYTGEAAVRIMQDLQRGGIR